ncbi:MAG: rod shape-determining protein MreD [Paramuribaculum sp.]|nr:rod shape-determining protein MreD [Paramuribaculum sp.]
MSKTTIKFAILAIVLILLQVIGLNNMCLFGVAMAFAYIYVLLHLPLDLSQNWVLTIGFFLGLIVDVFSDTPGMASLSCTIFAALRKPVLRLYLPREEDLTDPCPSSRSIGTPAFMKYAITMALIYCTLIYIIEAFSFFSPIRLVLRIISSTILTWLVIMGIDTLLSRSNEKRL